MPRGDSQDRSFDEPEQSDLFGAPAAPAYVPDPEHVRNRLVGMVEAMSAAATWPWDASRVRFFRETVWPYLFERLPDAEAADWRRRIGEEASRLDRAEAA